MSEVDLKPCPWCLKDPQRTSTWDGGWYFGVICRHAQCVMQPGNSYLGESREEADEIWNRMGGCEVSKVERMKLEITNDETEQFFDIDGNPCTLDTLCSKEPGWAASRIRAERAELDRLRGIVARYDNAAKQGPSLGLADAEAWLACVNAQAVDDGQANAALAVLAELDRLRAELAACSATAEAEHAEVTRLRELCGRAARLIRDALDGNPDGALLEDVGTDLEAAAKGENPDAT